MIKTEGNLKAVITATKTLKELRNRILRIILAWSLSSLNSLCVSPFSTYSFRKLVFHLSEFFCFE